MVVPIKTVQFNCVSYSFPIKFLIICKLLINISTNFENNRHQVVLISNPYLCELFISIVNECNPVHATHSACVSVQIIIVVNICVLCALQHPEHYVSFVFGFVFFRSLFRHISALGLFRSVCTFILLFFNFFIPFCIFIYFFSQNIIIYSVFCSLYCIYVCVIKYKL